MEFFNFLRKESTDFDRKIVFSGVAAGVINTLLIFLLTAAAVKASNGNHVFREMALVIIGLAGYWYSKGYLLTRTAFVLEGIIQNTRLRIAEKVRNADLASIETIGSSPIFNAVSTHATNISRGSTGIVSGSSSLVLVFCAFLVIFFISSAACLILLVAMALIILVFVADRGKILAGMEATSQHENSVMRGFEDLLGGFKELKMSSAKNTDFFENKLKQLNITARLMRIDTHNTINRSVMLATSALFILLAFVVFLLPVLAPADVHKLPRIVTIVVFIFGPMGEVVGVYPYFSQATASIREIYRVEGLLNAIYDQGGGDPLPVDSQAPPFEALRAEGLTFTYRGEKGENMFSLAPNYFEAKRGEIIFITGGNGSGKSTFLKVLAGLYTAASGRIFLNGNVVGPDTRQSYRDLFGTIFSDYHLFDALYGVEHVDPAKVRELLHMTDLLEKTSIVDRRITHLNLSSGQRKRLALVVALLEDKQVYLFDEWAAEQDPQFRRKFYHEILPNLKSQGKTIIAVTHDDDHYHLADRLLKMHDGLLQPADQPGTV